MTKKAAALAAVLAVTASIPTAAVSSDLLQLPYDLPDDLLAFIATAPASKDLVAGSGTLATGQDADRFHLSAHGSPFEANGNVRLSNPLFEVRGTVDCLFVQGNRAGISGTIESPRDDDRFFVVAVEDNGEPSGGIPDRAVVSLIDVPPVEGDCGLAFLLTPGADPILRGNIVVKDR